MRTQKMFRGGLVVLAIALAGCKTCPPKAAAPLEAYVCQRASEPIAIDGNLDDMAWREAAPIGIRHVLQPAGVRDVPAGTARFLWDDQFLYVAFDYADDDVWSYSEKADDDLWNGDVAEFFIKPSRTELLYYEFNIAPNGTLFDARFPSRGAGAFPRFRVWSSGAKAATRIAGTDGDPNDDDRGFTVEVALPLSVFPDWAQPSDKSDWTFAAFRYDYSKSYEDPLLLMSIPEAVGHGYHSYEGYQPLRFAK